MAYEFHYTPTGTGAISGAEVLEQTEDAINDLGNTAISDVQEALDKAERAFTNSANAVDDAQTALNTANNAEGVAIQAQNDVSNLSGTVTNIGNRVTTAEGNIGNLQGRMTTAEGNITNLQGRMTTAESNIGNLQTAVSTAQATANSAQQTATTARQQSYVFRYSSTVLVASSTNSNALLDNTDNLKVGDKVIDSSGVLFSITAIDTQNSTFTIGTATFVKSLNNTREVTSPSASSTVVLPIVATVTYTDQSPSQSATVNLRISADGSKSFYPNESGLYSLGLVSRNWDNVFSYMFESFGKNLGNEFSNNARTNLYLKSNRDTSGQSGVYVSKFRQNRAQGEMGGADVVQLTFDVLENSVRTNRLWYLNWVNWENDVPKTVEVRSFCEKVDYKLTHINDTEPSSLSLPSGNANDVIDISSYLVNLDGTPNTYTAPVNHQVVRPTAGGVRFLMPVLKNQTATILVFGGNIEFSRFIPCQGNV